MAALDSMPTASAGVLYMLLFEAAKAVANDGTFDPIGAFWSAEGELATVGVHLDPGYKPPMDEIHAYIEQERLREEVAKGARAVASVVDVLVTEEGQTTNAILVHLELEDGYVVDFLQPYSKKRLGGVVFGDPFTMPSDGRIFT